MGLTGAVVALMLSLPPCYAERNDPQRVEHVTVLGEAIGAVASSADDAAALVTIALHESALCWSVATGKRHGGDGWGPWQLEPGSRRQKPFIGADVSALGHAAGEALWLWRHSWQCGPQPAQRFRAYAGLPCNSPWRGAAPRAAFYGWAQQKLRTAQSQGAK